MEVAIKNSDVLKWLCDIFKENLNDISVDIKGTSDKGDGYMGDILFVTVKGVTNNKLPKEIEVVLKCSKNSDVLRNKTPIQQAFLNEISMYDSVFEAFQKFEVDRGMTDPFHSVAKYYGKYTTSNMEVIAFENLKKNGYDLWNRKVPFQREYLRTVLREYAKFHAISVAMQDQEPEAFEQLSSKLFDIMKMSKEHMDPSKMFAANIDGICDLLQDNFDKSIIEKWRALKNQCDYVVDDLSSPNESGVNVIIHGDCWCNNFMFNPASVENLGIIPEVAIIDWQISRLASPILDVSYFLFCGISKEDISSLNDFLEEYYTVFSKRLEQLGSSSDLYNKESFMKDWKKYRIYGLVMTNVAIKICLSEKEEAPDMMDSIEKNVDILETFSHGIKNEEEYKKRMCYIVEYAVNEEIV